MPVPIYAYEEEAAELDRLQHLLASQQRHARQNASRQQDASLPLPGPTPSFTSSQQACMQDGTEGRSRKRARDDSCAESRPTHTFTRVEPKRRRRSSQQSASRHHLDHEQQQQQQQCPQPQQPQEQCLQPQQPQEQLPYIDLTMDDVDASSEPQPSDAELAQVPPSLALEPNELHSLWHHWHSAPAFDSDAGDMCKTLGLQRAGFQSGLVD